MASAYCTRADIESYFGVTNVATWADVNSDGNGATIVTRIALAISSASDLIDAILRGGQYTIPLTDEFATIPPVIVKCCVQLAGEDLYFARGSQDFDADGEPIHRLRGQRKEAIDTLKMIRSGVLTLSDPSVERCSVPFVVPVPTSRDGLDPDDAVRAEDVAARTENPLA